MRVDNRLSLAAWAAAACGTAAALLLAYQVSGSGASGPRRCCTRQCRVKPMFNSECTNLTQQHSPMGLQAGHWRRQRTPLPSKSADGVRELIGNTPLVLIRSLSEATACRVR